MELGPVVKPNNPTPPSFDPEMAGFASPRDEVVVTAHTTMWL
jgi:hypothetical protein